MKRSKASRMEEPAMSDQTLLVSVEDLINIAMGPTDKNIVNFKMIQTILMILARQLRLLEQKVEIRITEESPSDSEEESPRPEKKAKPKKEGTKEERAAAKELQMLEKAKAKAEKAASKERERDERHAGRDKDKAEREREREERHAARDRERAERDQDKEERYQDKAEREREKEERRAAKEKEKGERATSKERDREDRQASKEREREERRAAKERGRDGREQDREERRAARDRDKSDRAESRERDREDRQASRERDKYDKERERDDKRSAKDREKADREREREDRSAARDRERADKERDREDRQASKERDRAERDRDKSERATSKERERGRDQSAPASGAPSGITVSEKKGKGKEKVLVVEKGPSTRADSRTRVGSIEVVTVSQFLLLESAVQDLVDRAAPLPMPSMPDNKKLRSDIAKGSASLTDTMQAMQVTARVQAAEAAITRMGDLLTQLAAAGALPEDVAGKVEADLQETMAASAAAAAASSSEPRSTARSAIRSPAASRKSVAIEAGAVKSASASRPSARPSTVSGATSVTARASSVGRPSMSAQSSTGAKVTRNDMEDELRALKEQLTKTIQNLTSKAASAVDTAGYTIKGIIDKMDVAMKMDNRIDNLYSLVSDYSEQLSGFDTGMVTQMQSFQEQIGLMRTDLSGGLTLLESVNNNAETAAVMELTERYEGLASELDRTALMHQGLVALETQLEDQLKSLIESVEMLREQKADRDEVADGLRDKADMTRLAGLLSDEEFVSVRQELERRLALCYEKFQKQDAVWLTALKDLSNITEEKAEILQLLSLKENTQDDIRDLNKKLRLLAQILGEPKAAMLTRKLARDATCGACKESALMEPTEVSFGAPAPLPAMLPRPEPEEPEGLCLRDLAGPAPVQEKAHMCKRWAGGSHTTLHEAVARARAPPMDQAVPTKRFLAYGADGELYMMEEELQPCVECNQFLADEPKDGDGQPPSSAPDGAGDQGRKSRVIFEDPKLQE